eukprot:CAMPEP_0182458914 /NCGR_PEP_ID=MMETSP1319-20130603/4148_1 /TAXON_ID=172717 /ORGANISM="Bolidomonas pacifica, Strain RCC208" /LENGTH=209 /DNA_ID=CAMNT_0024657699 /DNA_START=215 /DNA_END=840 /DNA_ORIENTATION=-
MVSPPSGPFPALPKPILSPHLCTILTTIPYIPGLIGLIKSLELTFETTSSEKTSSETDEGKQEANNKPPLICYVTNSEVLEAAILAIKSHGLDVLLQESIFLFNIFTVLQGRLGATDEDTSITTQLDSPDVPINDPKAFVDAPRRLLFLLPVPICYIDLDVLILHKDICHLIDLAKGTVGWTYASSSSSSSSASAEPVSSTSSSSSSSS